MATYNGEPYLEEQLRSILAQTILPGAIIVCDDRSTDGTVGILEKFRRQFPMLQYFVNDGNLGVIRNFKKAVSLATGNGYIALADQDDSWHPDKLEKLYGKLASIDDQEIPALVYSDLRVVDEQMQVLNNSFWNELGQDWYRHCFQTLLVGNFVTGCTILMNQPMRSVFADMPAEVTMHDAWISLVAFSFGKALVVNEALVDYRRHAHNLAFVNDRRRKNILQKMAAQLKLILLPNDYLVKQLSMVELFNQMYGSRLNEVQSQYVTDFLELKGKSYLVKRMLLRTFFKDHRIK